MWVRVAAAGVRTSGRCTVQGGARRKRWTDLNRLGCLRNAECGMQERGERWERECGMGRPIVTMHGGSDMRKDDGIERPTRRAALSPRMNRRPLNHPPPRRRARDGIAAGGEREKAEVVGMHTLTVISMSPVSGPLVAGAAAAARARTDARP